MSDEGEIKVFNPSKEISREITLEILMRHRDAMKQARIGEIISTEVKISDNERKMNQVRALNLIISSQREMITISRPVIYFRSLKLWEKSQRPNSKKEEQVIVTFEEHENDYNKLKKWLGFLRECEQEIIKAEQTKSLDDDFLIERQTSDGVKYVLTTNFYEMLEDLESSYEQVYLLMLTNKIVSAGIEEDEEKTYKQKEEEAVRRVVEA